MLKIKQFDDFEVSKSTTVGEYQVTKEEIVEFAKKWDPQPFHIDEDTALRSPFKGLIACSAHIMAIAIRLMDSKETKTDIIAGLGWNHVRFPNPVRAGDRLSATVECLTKRESRSKPDRGIVRTQISVHNQRGEVVVTYEDTIMVAKKIAKPA